MLTLSNHESGQIYLREHDVLEGRRLRALTLGREGDADLREEALHSCRCCRAAEVLACHHGEVGELRGVLLLLPPVERVPLRQLYSIWGSAHSHRLWYLLVHPEPPALLLVLDQILNVKLIVVDRAYCCLLLVLNSNNNNLS